MPALITRIEDVTPAWLTDVLHNAGHLNRGDVIEVQTVGSKRTNVSETYHLALHYSNIEESAPQRLFLKLPFVDPTWEEIEVRFYLELLPAMSGAFTASPWPFLHCYSAAYAAQTGRAYLLLEDLSATHFTLNIPMPPTHQLCAQVIDAYALLHAFWWEHPRLGQDVGALLTDGTIDDFIRRAQEKFNVLVEHQPGRLSREQREVLAGVVQKWPARRRERVVRGKGVTLVHRDPHPLNFLYPHKPEEMNVKLIDWQSWRVDTGTDDLAYMMACHWPAEHRAAVEVDLLKHYHERLLALGVSNYCWDECWYDYRASVVRCLFFLTIAWSPRQGESWWTRIASGVQAFEYLDCAEIQ